MKSIIKKDNHHIVLKIFNKIINIDDTNTPLNIESKDKKYIQNVLKLASKKLKIIKKLSFFQERTSNVESR